MIWASLAALSEASFVAEKFHIADVLMYFKTFELIEKKWIFIKRSQDPSAKFLQNVLKISIYM